MAVCLTGAWQLNRESERGAPSPSDPAPFAEKKRDRWDYGRLVLYIFSQGQSSRGGILVPACAAMAKRPLSAGRATTLPPLPGKTETHVLAGPHPVLPKIASVKEGTVSGPLMEGDTPAATAPGNLTEWVGVLVKAVIAEAVAVCARQGPRCEARCEADSVTEVSSPEKHGSDDPVYSEEEDEVDREFRHALADSVARRQAAPVGCLCGVGSLGGVGLF